MACAFAIASDSRANLPASSMSWMGSTDDEAQEDAQKTLGGLGQMALFRGATEHKLDMHDHQLKVLMRFRNTMVQVRLVDFFIGLINIYNLHTAIELKFAEPPRSCADQQLFYRYILQF